MKTSEARLRSWFRRTMVASPPHLLLMPVVMAWDHGGEDMNVYVHKIGEDQLWGVVLSILCFSLCLVGWWEARLHTGPIGKKTFEHIWVEK